MNELGFHDDSYGLMKAAGTLLATSCEGSLSDMTKHLNDAGKFFHVSVTESELSVFLQHAARREQEEKLLKLF